MSWLVSASLLSWPDMGVAWTQAGLFLAVGVVVWCHCIRLLRHPSAAHFDARYIMHNSFHIQPLSRSMCGGSTVCSTACTAGLVYSPCEGGRWSEGEHMSTLHCTLMWSMPITDFALKARPHGSWRGWMYSKGLRRQYRTVPLHFRRSCLLMGSMQPPYRNSTCTGQHPAIRGRTLLTATLLYTWCTKHLLAVHGTQLRGLQLASATACSAQASKPLHKHLNNVALLQ